MCETKTEQQLLEQQLLEEEEEQRQRQQQQQQQQMGNFFGFAKPTASKAPNGTVSERDRAVLDLKVSRDKCKRYMAKLEGEAAALKARAAAHLKEGVEGSRERALLLMKLRKLRTLSHEKALAQLLQLEEMTSQIESAEATAAVVAGIQAGNAVLTAIHGEMDAVAVEAVMDDLREATEVQSELQRALGEGLGLEATEEADAEAEYEAMMAEEEAAEAAAVAAALPDVPGGKSAAEQTPAEAVVAAAEAACGAYRCGGGCGGSRCAGGAGGAGGGAAHGSGIIRQRRISGTCSAVLLLSFALTLVLDDDHIS